MPSQNEMNWVCGIDAGSLRTASWVAWLKGRDFLLDAYCARLELLPPVPREIAASVSCYAIDAPQGLPESESLNRRCDREAGTPTNRLPASRKELEEWILFRGLIEMGIAVFWGLHSSPGVHIHGLKGKDGETSVIETYPRKTAKIFGLEPLPSKKKEPIAYVRHVWGFLRSAGFRCPSVFTPSVDQVDAMLCAIAAQAFMAGGASWKAMGSAPFVYPGDDVLREGFIVCPTVEWLKTGPE